MLTPGLIYVNAELRFTASFFDQDGIGVDPTTVTFRTKSPCGVEASYTYGTDANVLRASLGNYTADFTVDTAGRWHYRWQTTGTGTVTANEGMFNVQRSAFFDSCCSDYGPCC